jgi:hypothetical protein
MSYAVQIIFCAWMGSTAVSLCGIWISLRSFGKSYDHVKGAIRMFDVERATVYKTHLGGKLREDAAREAQI